MISPSLEMLEHDIRNHSLKMVQKHPFVLGIFYQIMSSGSSRWAHLLAGELSYGVTSGRGRCDWKIYLEKGSVH